MNHIVEPYSNRINARAFTLLEMLIAVAVLALLAGFAISSFKGSYEGAKYGKLTNDVTSLNSAVRIFLASGGNLSTADTPDKVLTKLKSQASTERKKRLTGVSSSVIDTRLAFRMQSTGEAAGDAPRARWNQTDMEFTIATSGAAGIKEFYFLDEEQVTVEDDSDQRASKMLFSKESGWIWDYQEQSPDAIPGPTQISLATVAPPPTVAATVTPVTPPPPVAPTALAEPTFSVLGGNYPLALFPMSLSLSNPNPAGVSKISYSLDSASWQDYSGAITLSPGSNVRVISVALDSAWTHSGIAGETYQAETGILAPPTISPSADTFGLFFESNITVTLSDPNASGTSIIRYRVNGSSWQNYSAPFVLQGDSYLSGATIEAQAISSGSPYYLSSSIAQRGLARESLNLSGSTTGAFHSPFGGAGMITNLAAGGSNSLFEWGDATGGSPLSQSWMSYSGATIGNIADSVRFEIGDLTYYNGTIRSGTGATTVDFNLALTLDINGNTFTPFFEFTFELINSPNVAGDDWGSADYVRLEDPRASRTLVLNGYEFEFRVEFGDSTSDGFAAFDEFHVLENKDASVAVYGTLVSLGPVTSNSDPIKGGTEVATDAGTGTEADVVFQKQGYIDTLEVAVELSDDAQYSEDLAKDALSVAEIGLSDALEGSQNITLSISEERYEDAGRLAADAKAGAADAEAAALVAEQAASDAYDAAVAAKLAASIDPTTEDAAIKVIESATAADAYATDARTAADEAAAAAAVVAAAVDNYKTAALDHIEEDGGDYVAFLVGLARAQRDIAKAKRDAAEASDTAASAAAIKVSDMLDLGKDDEAQDQLVIAVDAAASAEREAQAAEAASAAADAAASEATIIASGDSDAAALAAADANVVVLYADEARTYAVEARSFADMAAFAAQQASSLISQPVVFPSLILAPVDAEL